MSASSEGSGESAHCAFKGFICQFDKVISNFHAIRPTQKCCMKLCRHEREYAISMLVILAENAFNVVGRRFQSFQHYLPRSYISYWAKTLNLKQVYYFVHIDAQRYPISIFRVGSGFVLHGHYLNCIVVETSVTLCDIIVMYYVLNIIYIYSNGITLAARTWSAFLCLDSMLVLI